MMSGTSNFDEVLQGGPTFQSQFCHLNELRRNFRLLDPKIEKSAKKVCLKIPRKWTHFWLYNLFV